MESEQRQEDRAERQLFETIRATYPLAQEPEQHAMIKELRFNLPTISSEERMALIDAIENAVGQNIEDSEFSGFDY